MVAESCIVAAVRDGTNVKGAHRTMSIRLQLLLWLVPVATLGETRLLRFPDIHANRIVFVYAGDLWTASDQGGLAVRLTAHPGLERFPKFSPDGRWIAFTGQHDGHEQVYVMPSTGGEPRQLTWYPSNVGGSIPQGPVSKSQVHGWTPDGKSVVFRSHREFWDGRDGRLYLVSMDGGLPTPLEMARSGAGEISPSGEMIVFTPNCVETQWWNGYRGGQAQDLYLLHRHSRETRKITFYEGTDHAPMWIGKAVYFVSDRSGTLNLHRYDLGSNEIEQLTDHKEFEIRWPSSDSTSRIVFEFNGELRIFNVKTREETELRIRVPADNLSKRVSIADASRNIESIALSPSGKRAVISARGDVFTLPVEKGPVRNLTRSSDSHDRLATWSPDGRMIAFVSDRTGEEQVYQVTQDRSTQPEQLTGSLRTRLYSLQWSPDAKRISFYDKDGNLYVLDTGTRELTKIFDESRYTDPEDYDQTWSPRGRYLAFSARISFLNRSIFIWDRQTGSVHRIGDAMFNEYNPVWAQNGDYLYYLSEREFKAFDSGTEWNFFTDKQTAIIALSLRNDVAHPFPPESDEVDLEAPVDLDKGPASSISEPNPGGHAGDASIDFEELDKRVARVPVPAGNYSELATLKRHLGVVSSPSKPLGGSQGEGSTLLIFDTGERKTESIPDVEHWIASADGSKILVQHNDSYYVRSFPAENEGVTKLPTERLLLERVPSQEWRTIFHGAWRRFRDFFYVRNMHGFDWEKIRRKYEILLPHVSHRADLNYVIGEMVSELRVSHVFVEGGDFHRPKPVRVALLGVDFELDHSAQRYRIKRILNGHNEEPLYRSPLTEIGIDVREGDYLIEIDGVSLGSDDNPYRLLHNGSMDEVRLLVSDRSTAHGARTAIVRPIKDESNLRYLAWTEMNRKYVRERSNDTVGYIHLPSMADNGIREFIKWFYPQMRKVGLVVDVRGNTGGFISQIILERLRRERLGVIFMGAREDYVTYPAEGFFGRMVCLIDERSASDGDLFPLRFKAAGLGPLVGRRTWGGTVGIRSPLEPLMDGGVVAVPMFGIGEADGSWSVENQGTVPDIEVENDVRSAFNGRDLQLERAVEEVLRAIETDPPRTVKRPPDPVR